METIEINGMELPADEKTSELFNFINETQMLIERMGIHRAISIEAQIDQFKVKMHTDNSGVAQAGDGGIILRTGVITHISKFG